MQKEGECYALVSFKPTDEEAAFVKLARDFALEQLRPSARLAEEKRKVPDEITKKAAELGFLSLELPEELAGLELPLISQVQILEALASGDLGIVQGLKGVNEAASFIRLNPESPVLARFKNETSKGQNPVAAFLHANGKAHSRKLSVSKIGNGYMINGQSAPVKMAESADFLLIAGKDIDGEQYIFWLDLRDREITKKSGDYRLGLQSSGFEVFEFNNFKITSVEIFASGDGALQVATAALGRIRVLEAAKAVGLMSAALNYAAEYTSQRKAFGQEIAKFQGVSFTIAQMAIQTQAARNLVWHTAGQLDQSEDHAIAASAGTLYHVHRSLRFVTDAAVQLLGGHGYVQDHPVEKWMRDAQAHVNVIEAESELLAISGDYLFSGDERMILNDRLQAVSAPKPS
jgi:acyl-CoA dehydrogenase